MTLSVQTHFSDICILDKIVQKRGKGKGYRSFLKVFSKEISLKIRLELQGQNCQQSISIIIAEENPLMNVGVVGLQEPRISVTLYTSKTYLLSATQTPTQRFDRS